ncbi:hypothetical protein GGI07_000718 [Coemansia sp. Benny D115]|nr:hypothetical protein GGI07_000718 [Coemansia sp. Benny D115]
MSYNEKAYEGSYRRDSRSDERLHRDGEQSSRCRDRSESRSRRRRESPPRSSDRHRDDRHRDDRHREDRYYERRHDGYRRHEHSSRENESRYSSHNSRDYRSREHDDRRRKDEEPQSRYRTSDRPGHGAGDDRRGHSGRFDRSSRGDSHRGKRDPEFFAARKKERESIDFNIWAPSPTQSEDEEDRLADEKVFADMKKRLDSFNNPPSASASGSELESDSGDSQSSDYSSESDSQSGRKSKSRKRLSKSSKRSSSKRHKSSSGRRSERRSKSRKSSSSRHGSKRRHRRSSRRSKYSDDSESDSRSDYSSDSSYDNEHSARKTSSRRTRRSASPGERSSGHKEKAVAQGRDDNDDVSDGEDIGPMPDASAASAQHMRTERGFGGALLPGEGAAMAAFVQSGERIPRRGEIGVDQNMIERLENTGYVMSGNRHRRMNAVRMRKENQVISTEEKRQMLLANQEERKNKEAQIIAEFRDMLSKKQ